MEVDLLLEVSGSAQGEEQLESEQPTEMQMVKCMCQGHPNVDRMRHQDRGHLSPLLPPPKNAGQVLCLKSANGFAVAVLFVWWCWESKRPRS